MKYTRNFGWWLGMMTMLWGSGLLVQAGSVASNNNKTSDESQKAERLLQGVKADAAQIRSAAVRLDRLTASPDAKWLDYDRQWNEIKPAAEDMELKVARLATMQTAISSQERTGLDQSKPLIQEIQGSTHQLRTLLDQAGVQTNDAKFKAYARSLTTEASRLEKTVLS